MTASAATEQLAYEAVYPPSDPTSPPFTSANFTALLGQGVSQAYFDGLTSSQQAAIRSSGIPVGDLTTPQQVAQFYADDPNATLLNNGQKVTPQQAEQLTQQLNTPTPVAPANLLGGFTFPKLSPTMTVVVAGAAALALLFAAFSGPHGKLPPPSAHTK
jgi:hypothetical protein